MKKTSKEFIISTIICVLPLIFGLLVYKKTAPGNSYEMVFRRHSGTVYAKGIYSIWHAVVFYFDECISGLRDEIQTAKRQNIA